MDLLRTYSPIDGQLVVERPLANDSVADATLARARRAQRDWARRPLAERMALCSKLVDAFVSHRDAIAEEITLQMGRPIRHSPGEVRGFEERARTMIALAESSLVLMTGGSSVGTADLTAKVISDSGKPGVLVHGVAIKPGKPLVVGLVTTRDRQVPVFGLPGVVTMMSGLAFREIWQKDLMNSTAAWCASITSPVNMPMGSPA